MKERPILFTPENAQKVHLGTKTQTRRIVKPQPARYEACGGWGLTWKIKCGGGSDWMAKYCPHGQPGDRLWVREALCSADNGYGSLSCAYRADGTPVLRHGKSAPWDRESSKIVTAMFMPRWACRTVLELTAVRVERLQDISIGDCLREGIEAGGILAADPVLLGWAKTEYTELWESINGQGSWARNPWVWVLEFQKVGS